MKARFVYDPLKGIPIGAVAGMVVLTTLSIFITFLGSLPKRGLPPAEAPLRGIVQGTAPKTNGNPVDIPLRGWICDRKKALPPNAVMEHPLRGAVPPQPPFHFNHDPMQVTIKKNAQKNGIEFHFDQVPNPAQSLHLKKLGLYFRKDDAKIAFVRQHPAYERYANDLAEHLRESDNLFVVDIHPSFEPSEENITGNKFSYVTISHRSGNGTKEENFVVFDSYRAVSQMVAERFAQKIYADVLRVDIQTRKYKPKARKLLKMGKVITGMEKPVTGEGAGTAPKKMATPGVPENKGTVQHGPDRESLEPGPKPKKQHSKKSIREKYTLEEFIRYGTIGFDKLSQYKRSVARKAKEVMQEAIKLGYAIPFDYGRGKGKFTTTEAANKLSFEGIFKNVYAGIPIQELSQTKTGTTTAKDNGKEHPRPAHPFAAKEDIPKQGNRQCTGKNEKGQAITIICVNVMVLGNGYQGWNYTPFLGVQILFKQLGHPMTGFIRQLEKATDKDWGWLKDDLGQKPDLVTKKPRIESFYIPVEATIGDLYDDLIDYYFQEVQKELESCLTKEFGISASDTISKLRPPKEKTSENQSPNPEDTQVPENRTQSHSTQTEANNPKLDRIYNHFKEKGEYVFANQYDPNVFKLGDRLKKEDIEIGRMSLSGRGLLVYDTKLWKRDGDVVKKRESGTKSTKDRPKKPEETPNPKGAQAPENLAQSYTIQTRDGTIPHVLAPSGIGEPFLSGKLYIRDGNAHKEKYPHLWKYNDQNIGEAPVKDLFCISQMGHPKDYGIPVNRFTILGIWEQNGKALFGELGYPTDLDHPYVNIHTGYKSIVPLGEQIGLRDARGSKWWSVIEHTRPLTDLAKALEHLDVLLEQQAGELAEITNPKTERPYKKFTEQEREIAWTIKQLTTSKEVIQAYLNKQPDIPQTSEETPETHQPETVHPDYLDRVIAHLHEKYADGKRPTKGQIEKLQTELAIPNKGKLWEAAELSWLLWYKQLYHQNIPFESRLDQMVHFWNKLQPTYAYSDSSKELYKQYSTPCPIAAIVAEYTKMGAARHIFEPSAGNGLLVLGADPDRTHVNEIDLTRLDSLKFQQFQKITQVNAIEPFPEEWTKRYDVVVTNPPFAKWEENKFDKQFLIRKYFGNQIGLAKYLRLEHYMAGLALHTLKDRGRAAIIIMGHVHFGPDGLIARYRSFFNWLHRHYHVDDIINMNSFKLYNKQGAIERTMLILVRGRKTAPKGVAPTQDEAPHLESMVDSFGALWHRVRPYLNFSLDTLIQQLKKLL